MTAQPPHELDGQAGALKDILCRSLAAAEHHVRTLMYAFRNFMAMGEEDMGAGGTVKIAHVLESLLDEVLRI